MWKENFCFQGVSESQFLPWSFFFPWSLFFTHSHDLFLLFLWSLTMLDIHFCSHRLKYQSGQSESRYLGKSLFRSQKSNFAYMQNIFWLFVIVCSQYGYRYLRKRKYFSGARKKYFQLSFWLFFFSQYVWRENFGSWTCSKRTAPPLAWHAGL